MAQRVVTLYTDDITGDTGDGIASHTFALDGAEYEIDLGEDTYQKLLDTLGPYFRAARKTGAATRRGKTARTAARQGPDPAQVREWARSQGIEVNARGRIPADLVDKYQAAH
ncbi:Lsr2 family protein [Streptomyces sp. SID3343]|uniref:histone-like nucleoid-structuring protein Lsr2 n=1 Tax=Streptomyces sp. SID3343 TaxID=2690260 RepID=UPI001369FD08|nr:Lsr2 family protein [Streptomyces sp. SID3343]MYW00828.1 Lsr2 family protein [Streptomyces sp. SID3343]